MNHTPQEKPDFLVTPQRLRSGNQFGKQQIVIVVLLVLVVVVVFLLPTLVTEPWIEDQWSSNSAQNAPSSPTEIAPSTAAEKTKYRQDSQTLLAQIIALRDRLDQRQIQRWAEIEFRQALATIEQGDQYYSLGEYQESLASYQQSLNQLQSLETQGNNTLEKAITEGLDAVETGNINVAEAESQLATAIAPDDQRVQQLAKRVAVLPQVTSHFEIGNQLFNNQQFSAASDAYQQALELDPTHKTAQEALDKSQLSLTEQTFRRHMSDGFNAIEQNRFADATSHFDDAAKLHPNHQALTQARAQLENRQVLYFVGQQMRQAQTHEENEEWHEALAVYKSMLESDPTLTEAKVRQIPAQVRADLDSRIDEILNNPLTLSSGATYKRAVTALNDAKGINKPGEKLTYQIVRLEKLIELSVIPVDVQFQSDNLTDVTLFHVAKLGQFQQKTVQLKPGKYIVAGSRKGYRDVRIEFTVTGEPLSPIFVSCNEPI